MMPCVAKDSENSAKDKPKNIYKPKYHAFSIESLVGNDTYCKTNDDKNSKSETEDEEEDNMSLKIINPTPGPQTPNNGHKILNKCEMVDQNESLHVKNGILRSYMTTSSHCITSHNYNNSNYINSNNSNHNHLIGPRFDTVIRTNINNNSNNINHSNNSIPPVSTFNNQYYCNQIYCRPYDNRLMQNTFLPQVCDYESMLTKNADICCQSSFSPYRKPKRIRTAFSPGQLLRLEEIFERNRYVVGCERKQLARDLNLSETQIKVWFQNRRTKHKREKHQENGHKKTSVSLTSSTSLTGNSSDNEMDYKQRN